MADIRPNKTIYCQNLYEKIRSKESEYSSNCLSLSWANEYTGVSYRNLEKVHLQFAISLRSSSAASNQPHYR